jgi:hypothetical protein
MPSLKVSDDIDVGLRIDNIGLRIAIISDAVAAAMRKTRYCR